MIIDTVYDGGNVYEQPTELTNYEWLQSCTMEELAGVIYDWYSTGHIEGKHGKKLSSITPIVEWLKQPHTPKE